MPPAIMSEVPVSHRQSGDDIKPAKSNGNIYVSDHKRPNGSEKDSDTDLEEGHVQSAEEDFAAKRKQVSFPLFLANPNSATL